MASTRNRALAISWPFSKYAEPFTFLPLLGTSAALPTCRLLNAAWHATRPFYLTSRNGQQAPWPFREVGMTRPWPAWRPWPFREVGMTRPWPARAAPGAVIPLTCRFLLTAEFALRYNRASPWGAGRETRPFEWTKKSTCTPIFFLDGTTSPPYG